MDEKQRILQKLPELSRAQAALMNIRPPDIGGCPQEVTTLQNAVQSLQTAVVVSAGASQIMQAATTLLNA